METPEIAVGSIAVCSRGHVGIITQLQHPIVYQNGSRAVAYTGLHLGISVGGEQPVKPLTAWSSRYPQTVGKVESFKVYNEEPTKGTR